MKIENKNSPIFGAKFINNIDIGKLQREMSKYSPSKVSFVQIDPNNSSDIKALENTSKYWSYAKFATNIYHAASALRNSGNCYKDNKIFALTAQTDNFEKLDDNLILGLAHVSPFKAESLFLEHLQVKPDIIYAKNPEYKGAGSAILKSLKNLTSQITLFPSGDKSVRDFYEKNGFYELSPFSNAFTWVKDIFSQF